MQRVEVITGKERRRRWSEAEKARLVAETLEPGAIVAHVARRHGVAESCLYTWRRQLVGGMVDPQPGDDAALLIPVALETAPACETEPSFPPRHCARSWTSCSARFQASPPWPRRSATRCPAGRR
ncbi:hypothetical protein ABAZ39_33010 (plasmid) [Azospirillum argentinense]|uniref:Transposase n=1 Tax=Azospirillum argentinense TaxID=2970906 RepID=A0A060E0Z7_9PROT|nr:transposase [Azospirillum argentinense]AIB16659.1 hypothetical protein ABAZ39_33010 [Azospirillum argentinense]